MNANLNPIRQSRPNQVAAAGAALVVSSLLFASVIGLFAGETPPAGAAAAASLASAQTRQGATAADASLRSAGGSLASTSATSSKL
jgi:hypothetical protein